MVSIVISRQNKQGNIAGPVPGWAGKPLGSSEKDYFS